MTLPGQETASLFSAPISAPILVPVGIVVGIAVLLVASASWGPGLHIRMATEILQNMRGRLKPSQVKLLETYPHDFLYGNIAADIIHFKRYGGLRNHCHHWNMRERIEGLIDAEHEYAFLHGYLCHLAADVVAHNHFVPFQILHALPPRVLGHTYWEARADSIVEVEHWTTIDDLRHCRELHESDRVINRAVSKKALSMSSNKWIFNNILLARSRKSWRAVMDQMRSRKPRGVIEHEQFQHSLGAALDNMWRIFDDEELARLTQRDPNGHDSLRRARGLRQELIDRHGSRRAGADEACELARDRFGLVGE